MKQIEKKENNENLPIATEIIKIYKKSNKRLFTIVLIILSIMIVETTYLIFILDGLNNSVGIITEEVKNCE